MKLRIVLAGILLTVCAFDGAAQNIEPTAASQTVHIAWIDAGTPATPTKEQDSTRRRSSRIVWAVDMQPAAILANISADNFSVVGPNGKETLSMLSSVPTVTLGADMACLDGYLNLRVGGGMLLNASVGTWLATGQAGYSLEVQRNVMFGPHIGLSYFAAPEWWGDTDVTFDDTIGFLVGIHIAAGDRIAYLLTIDYMSMSFDVTDTGEGVSPSGDKLDMSGLAVQFGLRVQF